MSSEWSSIVSTLAEDDSSYGAHKIPHKQSEGPQRYAYSVDIGCIDPAATGFEHVNDAADHPSVINTRLATRIGRKKRLKPRKLTLR
jgi:hypothetical protein